MHAAADGSRAGIEHHFAGARLPAQMQQPDRAARAIAALFGLAAVGVENAVGGGGLAAARRAEHHRLVEADAAIPVGEGAPLRHRGQRTRRRIEQQEIIAEAVHLGELKRHAARIPDSKAKTRAQYSAPGGG